MKATAPLVKQLSATCRGAEEPLQERLFFLYYYSIFILLIHINTFVHFDRRESNL